MKYRGLSITRKNLSLQKVTEGRVGELVSCLIRESRRSNALLRADRWTDPLHTIYKFDGTISELFPKDVRSLFSMDSTSSSSMTCLVS